MEFIYELKVHNWQPTHAKTVYKKNGVTNFAVAIIITIHKKLKTKVT